MTVVPHGTLTLAVFSIHPMTAPIQEDIHGSFLTNPFAELVAEIHQAELTGSLRVSGADKKFIVYFVRGVVRFAVSNARSSRLFDILLTQKRLTVDDLRKIQNFAIDHELIGFLESTGFLDSNSRSDLYVEQINGILIDLLSMPNGEWSFTHLARLREGLTFDVNAGKILADYARCLPTEMILTRFRSLEETFTLVQKHVNKLEPTSDEVNIASHLNDVPTAVSAVIQRSGMTEGVAIKALYSLWLSGKAKRSNWHPAFSHTKVTSMLGAVLELKQEAKAYRSPGQADKPVEATDAAAPIAETAPAAPLTLDEFLARVAKAETHYDILGVDPKAETATLKQAYFTLAKNFHPDHYHKTGGDMLKRVQDAFTRLTQAHEALKSPEAREVYDFKVRKELTDRKNVEESGVTQESSQQFQQAAECFERGYSLLLDQEPEASLQFFARAVHFDPGNARYHAYYGKALSTDTQKRHKAEGEMQAAVKIDPNNPKYRLMLAEFFIAMKLLKRAEGELTRLLALSPTNREARELLASLQI